MRGVPPPRVTGGGKSKNGVGSGCSRWGGRTMLHVGVDEVGYGPLLGPLVVGVAAFRLTDHPEPGEANLLRRLRGLVVRRPKRREGVRRAAPARAGGRLEGHPPPVRSRRPGARRRPLRLRHGRRAASHPRRPPRAVLRPRPGALRAHPLVPAARPRRGAALPVDGAARGPVPGPPRPGAGPEGLAPGRRRLQPRGRALREQGDRTRADRGGGLALGARPSSR